MSGRKRNNLNVLCLTLAMSIFNVSVCIRQGGQRPPFVQTSRGSPCGVTTTPARGEPNPEPRTLTSKKPVVVRVCGHFGFRKTEPRTRTQTARRAKKKARPAVRLTRRAGFRIMAVVVGVTSTAHEYMRDKLTYSP